MISYSLIADSNGQSLTLVYSDGDTVTVPQNHPNFTEVRDLILSSNPVDLDENIIKDRLNIVAKVGDRLRAVSDRVRVSGNVLYFDGDPLSNALANHVLRLINTGDEGGYRPLISFLEKVQTNPSEKSRESLYSWISDRNFTITADGNFIAYKGVQVDGDGVSQSINSGRAYVNGMVTSGHIPNPLGAVIEMPRSEVEARTSVGCASGLHAGTWDYASDFARGRVLTVSINPRDVVSVPTDCSAQKLRVSRYTVVSEVVQEYSYPTYVEEDWSPEDDDEDEDWGDGEDDYY